ncbi:MAG: SCO1664 family protein [Anaerolineales bacterium]|jgi:uncharacterized repeat protein (TIGR03843 family)
MDNAQEAQILNILQSGQIEVTGQFVWGSNHTFLADVVQGQQKIEAVYKPSKGERPLWDFPTESLAAREAAAYLTSKTLGWDLVPPTILRQDGPVGMGSLQYFIDADPERHYFNFTQAEKQRLRPVAVFDILINNADRKGGHILLDHDDRLWLIDHGVSFHQDDKLRTVVWDFIGEPIPDPLLGDLQRFREALQREAVRSEFQALLNPGEVTALLERAADLLDRPRFPEPGPGRPYPWPLV